MKLSIKQINNLTTGIILACELKSNNSNNRDFLTAQGYIKDEETGCTIRLNKFLKTEEFIKNTIFKVHYYSLSSNLLEYDIDETDTDENIVYDNILGIEALEKILSRYLDDFSKLVPQWECDNPLE